MMFLKLSFFDFKIFCTLVFAGFLGSAQSFSAPLVIVSVEPLALLVKEICESDCEVWTLVPKGSSEHSWQPGPKDIVRAKSAVASIGVGLEFDERWFKKISANPKSLLLLGSQLSPMDWWSDDMTGRATGSHAKREHDHHHDHGHEHGALDPHVWTDAGRMSLAVKIISKHLGEQLPKVAGGITTRGESVSQRISELQLEVDQKRKFWKTRPVVVFHDVAGYFARRFNLPVLSVMTGGTGHELSAKMIAEVTKRFKNTSVAGILVERDDGAAKNLAKELKTKTLVVDFAAAQDYKKWDDWYLHLVKSWELVLQ